MPAKHKHNGHGKINLNEDIIHLKACLQDATEDVKAKAYEMLIDTFDDVKETSVNAKKTLSMYATKQPIKSLSIALALGFALGLLIRK